MKQAQQMHWLMLCMLFSYMLFTLHFLLIFSLNCTYSISFKLQPNNVHIEHGNWILAGKPESCSNYFCFSSAGLKTDPSYTYKIQFWREREEEVKTSSSSALCSFSCERSGCFLRRLRRRRLLKYAAEVCFLYFLKKFFLPAVSGKMQHPRCIWI